MTGSDSHAAGGQVVSNTQGHWKPFTGTERDTKPTANNVVVSVPEFEIIEIQCSLLSGSWVTDWLQVAPWRHRKARPAPDQLSHNHKLHQN